MRFLIAILAVSVPMLVEAGEMDRIAVARDGKSFVFAASQTPFLPRGFNYDHDPDGRLIEDYWDAEWERIETDFAQMKKLGANVVRVHLQTGKFLEGPDKSNAKSLTKLGDLLKLAEKTGLYLDLTGLGCYHKKDVPEWYDRLDEKGRWQAQAFFWRTVAKACSSSPAVFCYDLMNEPILPAGDKKGSDWLGPAFGGKHFVQYVSLDRAGRERPAIARAWIELLVAAVRKHDAKTLVTVGLVDWSLDRKGLSSGFVPDKVAPGLDFLCVHLYPEKGKSDEAAQVLAAFAAAGKPVVIEETFPLKCSMKEFSDFLDAVQSKRIGVIGFYWGRPPEELRKSKTFGDALTLAWLEEFQRRTPKP